ESRLRPPGQMPGPGPCQAESRATSQPTAPPPLTGQASTTLKPGKIVQAEIQRDGTTMKLRVVPVAGF
ncbi:MAG: hypothetical protein ACKOS8_12795, partial [Gemmataceae bacterium]